MPDPRIAITHASSLIAEALLQQLSASAIAADSVVLLDREQQAGQRLAYGSSYLTVLNQYEYDYEDLLAVCLLQPDPELEGLLKHADCYVLGHHLDSQYQTVFALDAGQALQIPGSPAFLRVADAQLSSLLTVIQPIHDQYGILSMQLVFVESAGLYGQPAIDELASQTVNLLNSREANSQFFPLQLAFNMIPADGQQDMPVQLQQLLKTPGLKCSVQAIVTASFYGLAISVSLELDSGIDRAMLESRLQELPGINLINEAASPLTHCNVGTGLLINYLQQPQNDTNRLQFWILTDAVRNGLIQNYQNILEILLKFHL